MSWMWILACAGRQTPVDPPAVDAPVAMETPWIVASPSPAFVAPPELMLDLRTEPAGWTLALVDAVRGEHRPLWQVQGTASPCTVTKLDIEAWEGHRSLDAWVDCGLTAEDFRAALGGDWDTPVHAPGGQGLSSQQRVGRTQLSLDLRPQDNGLAELHISAELELAGSLSSSMETIDGRARVDRGVLEVELGSAEATLPAPDLEIRSAVASPMIDAPGVELVLEGPIEACRAAWEGWTAACAPCVDQPTKEGFVGCAQEVADCSFVELGHDASFARHQPDGSVLTMTLYAPLQDGRADETWCARVNLHPMASGLAGAADLE